MSVSLISMIGSNVILNRYNTEHTTEQMPSAYYHSQEVEKDEDVPLEEEKKPEEVTEDTPTPSPEPSTEPVVSEPVSQPVETSCTPKQFANPYTYVYDNNDTCTSEGYNAFDYVSYNVNDRVFVFGCEAIVDDCGTTWYGVYYLVHNNETDQNEKFYY